MLGQNAVPIAEEAQAWIFGVRMVSRLRIDNVESFKEQ